MRDSRRKKGVGLSHWASCIPFMLLWQWRHVTLSPAQAHMRVPKPDPSLTMLCIMPSGTMVTDLGLQNSDYIMGHMCFMRRVFVEAISLPSVVIMFLGF